MIKYNFLLSIYAFLVIGAHADIYVPLIDDTNDENSIESYTTEKFQIEFPESAGSPETIYHLSTKIEAVIPKSSQRWVPLGIFKHATIHKLVLNGKGASANGAMTLEFAVKFGQTDQPEQNELHELSIINLSQTHAGSNFQLYWYRPEVTTNFRHKWIGLVALYDNLSNNGENTLKASHYVLDDDKWLEYDKDDIISTFTNKPLAELENNRVKSTIEYHKVTGSPSSIFNPYPYETGLTINSPTTFTNTVNLPAGSITADALNSTVLSDYLTTSSASQNYIPRNPDFISVTEIYGDYAFFDQIHFPDGNATILSSDLTFTVDSSDDAIVTFEPNVVFEGGVEFVDGSISESALDPAILEGYLPLNGGGNVTGASAFATPEATTVGDYATAMGSSHAYGEYSIAMGRSYTTGDYATALGYSTAYLSATALGSSIAEGVNSTAMGQTYAIGYGTTTIGQFNEFRADFENINYYDTWIGDDLNSVLEVGIGTSWTDLKNALTVFQDGSCDIGYDATDGTAPLVVNSDGSVIITKRQGDISMGEFATSEPTE